MARQFGANASDIVTTPLTSVVAARSISIWALQTGDGSGGNGRVWAKSTADLTHREDLFQNAAAGTTWAIVIGFSGGNNNWTFPKPLVSTWHHIFYSYDYDVTHDPVVYVDNVAQIVTNTVRTTGTIATSTDPYTMGNIANLLTRNWAGSLCRFSVYNSILNTRQIQGLYQGVAQNAFVSDIQMTGASLLDLATNTSATESGTVTSADPNIFQGKSPSGSTSMGAMQMY